MMKKFSISLFLGGGWNLKEGFTVVCLETRSVDHADLQLREICLPLPSNGWD